MKKPKLKLSKESVFEKWLSPKVLAALGVKNAKWRKYSFVWTEDNEKTYVDGVLIEEVPEK